MSVVPTAVVRTAVALVVALGMTACNAVVTGGPLSSPPQRSGELFLSTGPAPGRYQTIGFVQIRGYGVQIAGFADVGDHNLDGTIRGSLAEEAVKLGGDGVVNIEFLDENPSTDAERIQAAYDTAKNLANGKAKIDQKDRYVTVTGEVIRFVKE